MLILLLAGFVGQVFGAGETAGTAAETKTDVGTLPTMTTADPLAEYELLRQWRFSETAIPIPADGISWATDAAAWTLGPGTLRIMEPAADGAVTGVVFEGRGRLRVTVPDEVETRQLWRFTNTSDNEELEFSFTQLVLRTSGRLIHEFTPAGDDLASVGGTKGYAPYPLARNRHQWWLHRARFDADARITAGRRIPGDEYLFVDMNTEEHGWLFYEFDGLRMEEIRLGRQRESYDFVEVWLSLDRSEHRREDGRPGPARNDLIDLVHADLDVDLMEHGSREARTIARGGSYARDYPRTGFRSALSILPLVDGLGAIQLRLHPYAEVTSVEDGNGRTIPFVRAHLGKLTTQINGDEFDTALTVFFPEPLARDSNTLLTITYTRRTSNYPGTEDIYPMYIRPFMPYPAGGGNDWNPAFVHLGGRYWYPETFEGWNDRHTVRLSITHPKNLQVRASGRLVEGGSEGKRRVSVWQMDEPVRTAGFAYGFDFKERRIILEDNPEVIGFGVNKFNQVGDKVKTVTAHVADSINFFQQSWDFELPMETVTATRVKGGNQAFDNLIAVNSFTFRMERAWSNELELARRVSMLFWGQSMGWESVRDQWLADALCRYSAMMYLEHVAGDWGARKKGAIGDYKEYLHLRTRELAYATSYRNDLLGPPDVGYRAIVPEMMSPRSSRGTFSYSSRRNFQGPSERSTRGIVDLRAKGQMVLHMLRTMLEYNEKGGEGGGRLLSAEAPPDLFNVILGDFLNTHAGKTASTRGFIKTVEKYTGQDWEWFFDQWVYGSAVPVYTWSHILPQKQDQDGLYPLSLRIQQERVPEGFTMPVPFLVEFDDGTNTRIVCTVDRPVKTFRIKLERMPVKLIFNPDSAVMARVE